jgi:hypothetical protein
MLYAWVLVIPMGVQIYIQVLAMKNFAIRRDLKSKHRRVIFFVYPFVMLYAVVLIWYFIRIEQELSDFCADHQEGQMIRNFQIVGVLMLVL